MGERKQGQGVAWRVVFRVEGWLAMSWLPDGGQVWLAAVG